jgi:uncharacterized protein (DUF302 family)
MIFKRVTQAILLIGGVALSTAALATDNWQVKTSPHSVADTVARLTVAIEGGGAKVAAVVDHAAAAANADLDLAPTTVVIFGNPKLGTPLMQEDQRIGIDLPLRILVWQDGDTTMVGYVEPDVIAGRYGIGDDNPSIVAMEGALGKLTDAAIAE